MSVPYTMLGLSPKGGLERRYHVERIRWTHQRPAGTLSGDSEMPGTWIEEREPIEDSCFVLRPERDAHAIPSLRAYADACEPEHPALAEDLRRWLNELDPQAAEEEEPE